MTMIELPDDQAAALNAKAASQGLTLQAWLKQLAESDPRAPIQSSREAVERILQVQKRVQPDPEGWTVKDYISLGRP